MQTGTVKLARISTDVSLNMIITKIRDKNYTGQSKNVIFYRTFNIN